MWLIKTFENEVIVAESRIPKMALCGINVGNSKLFWKYWTNSDDKHITWPHS